MSVHPDNDLSSIAPEQRVRVAILTVDDEGLTGTLEAIERQVYGIEGITIVDQSDGLTGPHQHPIVADFAAFVAGLDTDVDLVWIVHGDARPRPDALGALVHEMERNDASLVGSKIVDGTNTDRLESVGSATDVFGEPYTGLDPDEVDLEQYDVVRDVAFVSAVSMLVRRDLLRGLRGIDPLLPPMAAGMDFSQRARVAGGRVMVVPSSEVLHGRTCRDEYASWQEWAGRMRSMLKAYRLVTLAWVVPVGTLLGFIDGFARLFLGTIRPIADFWRAMAWNAVHLPGSLTARNAVRAVRHVGDEEMFRYQVTGSVRLRGLMADVGERFGWVIDDEPGVVTEEELEDEATAAGAVVAAFCLIVIGLATRSLWAGALPQSGFTFHVLDPGAAIAGFAGGWNPAGLGSPEPVHPSVALLGAVQWLTGGWSGSLHIVIALLLTIAFLSAGRLLREVGVTGPTRHLGGLVAVLGPASAALAGAADLAGLLAVGPTLGAVLAAVLPWPRRRWPKVGRLGALVLASSSAALLAPLAPIAILLTTLVLWSLLPGVRATVAARGLVAADLGLLAVAPYLLGVSIDELSESGPTYDLFPSPVVGILLVVAALASIAFLPGRRHRVAAGGGLLLSFAAWIAAVEPLRGDLGVAVLLVATAGLVLVVGAASGLDTDAGRITLAGRTAASLAAVGLVVVALAPVVEGRAGFPPDRWSDRLDFTTSLGSEEGASRVLLVGAPAELPGEHRAVDDVTYRVVDVAGPGLESARLGRVRLGDEALAEVVSAMAGGELVRPGDALAAFGIGWVAVIDDASFAAAMSAQVDMDEIPVREDLTVFRSRVPAARAVSESGAVWEADGSILRGPAGPGTLRIADNASPRWQPDWAQDDWATRVSTRDGVASYTSVPLRRSMGWVTAVLIGLGVVALPFGRRLRR